MPGQSQDDPTARVVERMRRDRPWMVVMLAIATCLHIAAAFALPRVATRRVPRAHPAQVVDIDLANRQPPPPIAQGSPATQSPQRITSPVQRATTRTPAKAATVVTRPPNPDDPVDLTDTVVIGSAATYAGGATLSNGSNPSAGDIGGPPGPVVAKQTAPSPPPREDHSRTAALAEGANWECPFPPEREAADIFEANATIRVEVAASGAVEAATVVRDPGHGFGAAATRCARTKQWAPALDAAGKSIDSALLVNVQFERRSQ